MRYLLIISALLFSLSTIAQSSLEVGAAYGKQRLHAPKGDQYPNDFTTNHFTTSDFWGVYLGYRIPLEEKELHARAQFGQGTIAYDLNHSWYSKGNGGSGGYYNKQEHDVDMYGLQVGYPFMLLDRTRTRLELIIGPEVVFHKVRASEGAYGDHRYNGVSQDSTGVWVSGGSLDHDVVIDGASQESLTTLLFGLYGALRWEYVVNEKFSLITGIEGALGLSDMIDGPGEGHASKWSYGGTLGLRYMLPSRVENN